MDDNVPSDQLKEVVSMRICKEHLGLPHCFGAIDCTHIPIRASHNAHGDCD